MATTNVHYFHHDFLTFGGLCVPQDNLDEIELFPSFKDELIRLPTPEFDFPSINDDVLSMDNLSFPEDFFHEIIKNQELLLLESSQKSGKEEDLYRYSEKQEVDKSIFEVLPINICKNTTTQDSFNEYFFSEKQEVDKSVFEVLPINICKNTTTQDSFNEYFLSNMIRGIEEEYEVLPINVGKKPRTMSQDYFHDQMGFIENQVVERKEFLLIGNKKPRSKRRQNSTSSIVSKCPKGLYLKRKCNHCQTERTPQWRMGPMGPKTLCNACGVRYKSGRLVPEYRPAASPSFDSRKHSNFHRRIVNRKYGSVLDA